MVLPLPETLQISFVTIRATWWTRSPARTQNCTEGCKLMKSSLLRLEARSDAMVQMGGLMQTLTEEVIRKQASCHFETDSPRELLTCTNIRCKVFLKISPIGCSRHSLTIFNSSLSFYTFVFLLFHSFRALLPKQEPLQSCTTSRLSCCLQPSHRRAQHPTPVPSNHTGNVCFAPTTQQTL